MKTIATTLFLALFSLFLATTPATLFAQNCPNCGPGASKGWVWGKVNDSQGNTTIAGSDGSLNTVANQQNSHTLKGKALEPGFSGGAFGDSGQASYYSKGAEFGNNGFAQHTGQASQEMRTVGTVDGDCPDLSVRGLQTNDRTVATGQAVNGDSLTMNGSILGKGNALGKTLGGNTFVGGNQQWQDSYVQGVGDETNGAVQRGGAGGWTNFSVGQPQD